ncbi:unnamed protein product, partial [Penicillium nalgiovense]
MAPSDVHFASLDEINNPKFGNLQLYCRTKLAIILGVKYRLLERVIRPNNDNILRTLCPSRRAFPGPLGKLLTTTMLTIGRDVEQGCFSALYAATSPE